MFYIQHGFGKSTKIDDVAASRNSHGVILSPANEDPSTLAVTASHCRSLGLNVLYDPQSYIYSLDPVGTGRHHEAHQIEFTDMHWAPTADAVTSHLEQVRAANLTCGTTDLMIAPSPFQTSLMDYWMPTAIQYARTASQLWGPEHTLASIVIDENVLTDWNHVQDWLDVLTTLEVRGFYLLVNRNRPTNPPSTWNSVGLSNLLRVIYTLTDLNDYELHWGYSDLDGLLGIAAGASSAAAGWSFGNRQFSIGRWNEVRKGGAPAVPRVAMKKLLASVRYSEAEDLAATHLWEQTSTRKVRDSFENRDFEALKLPESQVQHLTVLGELVSEVGALADLSDRLDLVTERLHRALELHTSISNLGLALDARYAARLRTYLEAVTTFRKAETL